MPHKTVRPTKKVCNRVIVAVRRETFGQDISCLVSSGLSTACRNTVLPICSSSAVIGERHRSRTRRRPLTCPHCRLNNNTKLYWNCSRDNTYSSNYAAPLLLSRMRDFLFIARCLRHVLCLFQTTFTELVTHAKWREEIVKVFQHFLRLTHTYFCGKHVH